MSNTALQKKEKLNQLLRNWPSGTVMVQFWLEKHGISRQLSYFYVKSGWIEKIGQGAFIKARDKVDWMGGLYTLRQQCDFNVHLGGRSLLEITGASHFVPLGNKRSLYIYADANEQAEKKALPKWFLTAFQELVTVTYLSRGLFSEPVGIELLEQPNFTISVSTKERALMEVLALTPQVVSYSHAYLLFQGQQTLRPHMVQILLESCISYKVKRLFLHLGKKCELPWFKYLKLDKIDLGKGKRQIGLAGARGDYDSEYGISVPKLGLLDDQDSDIEV